MWKMGEYEKCARFKQPKITNHTSQIRFYLQQSFFINNPFKKFNIDMPIFCSVILIHKVPENT